MAGAKVHELKCWPSPFEAMERGDKTFEVRRDDRGFAVGDLLDLREWAPLTVDGKLGEYTGRQAFASVSHIERGPDWGIPAGYVVMAIRLSHVRGVRRV